MTNVRSRTIMALTFELSVICRAQYQDYKFKCQAQCHIGPHPGIAQWGLDRCIADRIYMAF